MYTTPNRALASSHAHMYAQRKIYCSHLAIISQWMQQEFPHTSLNLHSTQLLFGRMHEWKELGAREWECVWEVKQSSCTGGGKEARSRGRGNGFVWLDWVSVFHVFILAMQDNPLWDESANTPQGPSAASTGVSQRRRLQSAGFPYFIETTSRGKPFF